MTEFTAMNTSVVGCRHMGLFQRQDVRSMTRKEFSKSTKLAVWDRCKGFCEACQQKIIGRPEYDHICPDGLYGSNEIENCQALCVKCHRLKTTTEDVPKISKADRLREKAAGVRAKRKWPSRKFNGSISWNR